MQVDIRYKPSYSLAIVDLAAGESVIAEGGAMVSMSANVGVETSMRGGLAGALKRKVLGGESFFVNTFTASGGAGEITFAPSLPGDLQVREMNGETFFLQSGSYIAAPSTVSVDTQWGGAKTFFGSEGLFLLKAQGQGPLIFSSYGAIHEVELTGQPYIVDTGHIVGFTSSLNFNVRRVGGWKSTVLSGEGLVCEFTGTGKLFLQTRSSQAFLSWLLPKLPKGGASGGGRGSSGILGSILGGDQ